MLVSDLRHPLAAFISSGKFSEEELRRSVETGWLTLLRRLKSLKLNDGLSHLQIWISALTAREHPVRHNDFFVPLHSAHRSSSSTRSSRLLQDPNVICLADWLIDSVVHIGWTANDTSSILLSGGILKKNIKLEVTSDPKVMKKKLHNSFDSVNSWDVRRSTHL